MTRTVQTFAWLIVVFGMHPMVGADDPPPNLPMTIPLEVSPQLPPPTMVPPPKLWTGSVDLGITGSEGNSQNFNFTSGFKAKRDTQSQLLTLETLYNYSTAESIRTQNRLLSQARNEWRFGDSPWSVFWNGSLEYDEFWAFNVRLATHLGLSYQFVRTEATSLKGRAGFGLSRQIGGDYENRIFPEMLLGMDFEHRFTERTKFVSSVDVFPDIGDISNYRAQVSAAFEATIDPETNLGFKIGFLDRYNSVPQGNKRNDLNYFAALTWSF